MRYLLAALATTCGLAAAPSEGPSLTVLLTGNDVPTAVLTAMEHEAATALGSFRLVWKTNEDRNRDFVVNGPLALIHMRGECVAELPSGTEAGKLSAGAKLGVTHLADGQVLPIADVFCDAVRDFVGPDLRHGWALNRDELYGRALGRVLAHELYHIVLQTTDHGADGLSRRTQRSADLLVPQRAFLPSEEQRLAESAGQRPTQSLEAEGGR
jgi:hypothetical protein